MAAQGARKAATHTTLEVSTGTIGQPIHIDVTVRAAASAGAPQGTVNLVDHGTVIATLTLTPTASSGRSATSEATATLSQPPGGSAYDFGRHPLSAVFVPSGSFTKSSANKAFVVSQPSYTALADGVKVATVMAGSGAAIQSGQTAEVLYTGYLAKNGKIFDESAYHGGTPLGFTVGAGQVITGFDEGTVGMQVGETRAILIPAAEGYGSSANGSIPANSTRCCSW